MTEEMNVPQEKEARYETPVAIPLGELAKAQGDCHAGGKVHSNEHTPRCNPGGGFLSELDHCISGGFVDENEGAG
jgi:hypothetical protein